MLNKLNKTVYCPVPCPVSLSGSGAFTSDDVVIAFTQKRTQLTPKQDLLTGTFSFAALPELQD